MAVAFSSARSINTTYPGHILLSNSDLTVTKNCTHSWHAIACNGDGVNSGKWYWETTIHMTSNTIAVGIVNSNENDWADASTYALNYMWLGAYGYFQTKTSSVFTHNLSAGDVIGFALDMETNNGQLTVYVNGVSKGVVYSDIKSKFPAGAHLLPAAKFAPNGASITANFGASSFVYSIPSGFLSYNQSSNSPPVLDIAVDSQFTFENEIILSINLSDSNNNRVKYQVLINNVVVLDWSALTNSPVSTSYSISAGSLVYGINTIKVRSQDEFGGATESSLTVYKKSLDGTYVSSTNPDLNYFQYDSMKVDSINTTLLKFPSFNSLLGYFKKSILTLKFKTSGIGNLKIYKITEDWSSTSVTNNTIPVIDNEYLSINISNETIKNIDITSVLGNYGVAISCSDSIFEIDIIGNQIVYEYDPSKLVQPEIIYSNKVSLNWSPIIMSDDFISLSIERSEDISFNSYLIISTIFDENQLSYLDDSVTSDSIYFYRLKFFPDTVTSIIQVPVPVSGYKNILNPNQSYLTLLTEGIAFDDVVTDFNFYTTPDKIIIRPYTIGNIIGGRFSNIQSFEVFNSSQNNYRITMFAIHNNSKVEDTDGNYGVFQDSEELEWCTRIGFSFIEDFSDNISYPAVFDLLSNERKIIYFKIKPSIYLNVGINMFNIKISAVPI